MAIKHFKYTKQDGSISFRYAHPMGIVADKILTVDLTEFDPIERYEYETILNEIHRQYIQAVKEAGLGNNFRYFFINGIEDIDG